MAFRNKRKGAPPQSAAKTAPTFDFERQQDMEHDEPQHHDDAMTHPANIGESVQINGELTSSEDVTVEGTVEGAITLTGGNLVVARTGHIQGDCHARAVVIDGTVVGNVSAEERVEITPNGTLEGDITAARVVLSEGAAFRGKVDMGTGKKVPKRPKKKAAPPPALDFDLPAKAESQLDHGDGHEHGEHEPAHQADVEPVAETDDGGSDDMLASLFDDEAAKT